MHSHPIDTNAQQRSQRAFAASFNAMGWVSMLLLVSGTSAFAPDVTAMSRISRVPDIPCSGALSAACGVASTGRQYRRRINLRTPPGVSRSKFHTGRSSTPTEDAESFLLYSTRLRYRDGDEHEGSATGWWRGFLPKPVKEEPVDEKQRRVDDYLEFLDRRYNRLHSDEKKKEPSKKAGFSAWHWLVDQAPEEDQDTVSTEQHEDALYVLGVAELASEKLLQKRHLTVQQHSSTSQPEHEQAESGVVIDATVIDDVPPATRASALMLSGMVDAGAAVLRRLHARRNVLIRYQTIKLRAAMRLAFKTLSKAPRTAASLWKISGGTKSVALTAAACATVFLLVRPVVKAMIYQAAYRG